MSYFAIESNQKCYEHVLIKDNNDNAMFKNYLDMTYDEMKDQEDLEEFVVAVMEAVSEEGAQTIVTLIGDDDIFIWSIIIGMDGEDLRYVLVDWKKDGKSYRYEPEGDLTN